MRTKPHPQPKRRTPPSLRSRLYGRIAQSISAFHAAIPRRQARSHAVLNTRVILISLRVRNSSNLTYLAPLAPFQFPGNLILSVSPYLTGEAGGGEGEQRGKG